MNNEAKKRVQDLFEGMEENTLSATDPEWVDIVANFSQNETVKESKLTQQKGRITSLDWTWDIPAQRYSMSPDISVSRLS